MENQPIDENVNQPQVVEAEADALGLAATLQNKACEPKPRLRDYILLFIRGESLAAFCYGYLLLLACLGAFKLPWIGLGLSFIIESIAAGYYLHIMQVEIHGTPGTSLAHWPKLDIKGVAKLLKLGMFTNLIQITYAAFALSLSLPLFIVVCLTVAPVGFEQVNAPYLTSYAQLFMTSAAFTMPFSFWVIIVMAPVALARYAHSGNIKDAFDFKIIANSIVWGSSLIKGSAAIYFAAILANSTLMSLSPALMNVLEPIVEFSSMAFVCRLNARWYRQVLQEAITLEEKSEEALATKQSDD
ncbi:MAG: DUF4013 domain-containing protein [Candidatus Melainabacteria bacterium]|nr:DUF4013 domain-containing protein [Candidatus Melainabacteria bacterium]